MASIESFESLVKSTFHIVTEQTESNGLNANNLQMFFVLLKKMAEIYSESDLVDSTIYADKKPKATDPLAKARRILTSQCSRLDQNNKMLKSLEELSQDLPTKSKLPRELNASNFVSNSKINSVKNLGNRVNNIVKL